MRARGVHLSERRVAELRRVRRSDSIEADRGVPVEERLELSVVEARRQAAYALSEAVEAHQAGVVYSARPQSELERALRRDVPLAPLLGGEGDHAVQVAHRRRVRRRSVVLVAWRAPHASCGWLRAKSVSGKKVGGRVAIVHRLRAKKSEKPQRSLSRRM